VKREARGSRHEVKEKQDKGKRRKIIVVFLTFIQDPHIFSL
jgi:hypothetical protein